MPAELCNGADDDCDGRTDEGVANACGGCGPLPTEVCNGQDDDCDNRTDEVAGAGNPCQVGLGGCAVPGVLECQGAALECNVVAGMPTAEECNGIDDDCDNQTDEGGVCVECVDEVCNGGDDDCDGRTDENVTNACGECGALPAEVCNGADDDCDNRTDEGVTNACGECGAVPAEACNGEDDDCDDTTDEDYVLGGPCSAGQGECRRDGSIVCDPPSGTRCDAVAGRAAAEACNGLDDDCDGNTDEGVLNACGNCGRAPAELCDGVDNDCDNRVDETFNLQTDRLNCGRCNVTCPARFTDRCRNGGCSCGDNGFCEPGEVCTAGECIPTLICPPRDEECIEP